MAGARLSFFNWQRGEQPTQWGQESDKAGTPQPTLAIGEI